MKLLFVIPARGGSKGIPHKNIKPIGGKPLICHAIDQARSFVKDEDICVTTDDREIIQVVEDYGLKVPFVRPAELATDTAGSNEVILHALSHYEQQGKEYDAIVLLQPTSPFRDISHIKDTLGVYSSDMDMTVTVKEAKANPYYNCFEENSDGYLKLSKDSGEFHRRQDVPKVWEYNGAVYVINPSSLKKMSMSQFTKVKKCEMDEIHSVDLDTMLDWKIAELLLKEGLV